MRRRAARRGSKAPLAGAFLFVLTAPSAAALECPAKRIDARARVDTVYDGDTVRVADDTDVRLVGIDTPEIGREGDPDQPYSRAARAALLELLDGHERRIHLRLGAERRDDHGRLLAHAYLPDGRSIARLLLQRGYGAHVTVPPNTWRHRCYARAERIARTADRRIWGTERYQGVAARALAPDAAGFRIVSGRIRRVGESERSWWLELAGLTLHLPKRDLDYFHGAAPRRWHARRLRVRGWIYRVDGQARMDLRHPASLEWLGDEP